MSASLPEPPEFAATRRYQIDLLILLLFAGLTALAARPVVTRLDTVIIGQDSDVPINLWADWWTRRALTERDVSLWETDMLFYPQGVDEPIDLSFHSFSHLNTLVSLTLRPLLGTLPAYNLAILLNLVLAGMAMFQLARYLTGSLPAGIIAGLIFAFNPHMQYQTAHPVLLSVWCFPWATLLYLRGIRERRAVLVVGAALVVFLGAASSTLLLIMLAIWMAALTVYILLTEPTSRRSGRLIFLFAALATFSSLPLLWPLLRAFLLENNDAFVISSAATLYMTDIGAPLIPHWYIWLVRGLYLGIVPFLLVVVARYQWRAARLWYLLAAAAYLISIGPYPTFFGRPLGITLPWSLPFVPLLRNPYRFTILFSLGLAVLGAYGWKVISSASLHTPRMRVAGALLCGTLIFVEYTAPRFPLREIPISPFYSEFLASDVEEGALAHIPTNRSIGKTYMYYQTVHERPITGGTISRRSAAAGAFIERNALLRAGATDLPPADIPIDLSQQFNELAAAGIAFVVLDADFLGESGAQWRRALPLRPAYEDEHVVAFRTDLQPDRDFVTLHRFSESVALFAADLTEVDGMLTVTLGLELRAPVEPNARIIVTAGNGDANNALGPTISVPLGEAASLHPGLHVITIGLESLAAPLSGVTIDFAGPAGAAQAPFVMTMSPEE